MAGKKDRPAHPTATRQRPRGRASNRPGQTSAATLIAPLIDDIPGGICLVDEALRVRVANRAFRTLLALPRRLVEPGSSVIDLIRHNAEFGAYGDIDAESAIAARLKALRRRRTYSCPLAMPDGRKVELKGAPLAAGGYAIIATDVTEQRRAEELATLAHRR
ncbi:MAG TPA: PAS-domain containing protein, partial [Alphaproteobacteria bacterium]|nr:PAS-domain containing protein [Alphaproteobacteria bacterium]